VVDTNIPTSRPPADDSNECVAAGGLLGDERSPTVSLAGVLPFTASADHVGGDLVPSVVVAGTLAVGHGVQCDLPQRAGQTPARARGPPTRSSGLDIIIVV